ncbi:MAG: hypothetical protein QOG43_765 [Actinomycetota bacterium]|jgi:hypothetical protein|nr:hypothetical protein [Actinomycetota bacterium]
MRRRSVLRYTGVAAVATVWTTLLTASAVSGFDLLGPDPLSYMGSDPRAATLFTIGLAVPAILLAAFHHDVRRRYPVGAGFSVAMLGGLAGQMVAAFVPLGGGPAAHRIHTAFALALGVSLPLLMWRFAAGQQPGPWRRLAYRLFLAEAAACAAGLYLSARSIAPLAEILPGIAFHTWVFVVTFRSQPEARAHAGGRARPAQEGQPQHLLGGAEQAVVVEG